VAEVIVEAEVRLWGQTVAAVVELDNGRIIFEYADDFRRSGLEISPVHLPLSLAGPQSFEELQRQPAFQGLPGVLADALPDKFGNQVIRSYFAARGQGEQALRPVQRLLYVGERGLGALTFHPAEQLGIHPAVQEALEIAALVADARRIVEGDADVTIPEIYRISASAGGMRPKAVVLYNAGRREIRSGYAEPRAGDVPALLKFDGVGDGASADELGYPQPYNRVEAAYMRMAAAAGIEVAEVEVLESDGYTHLIVPRFDIEGSNRIHQHTFGGLAHVDYHVPGSSSYEEYLRSIYRLGMPQAAVEEGFRRMVFNLLAVNQDDHVKNQSFHMRPDGAWSLTPAYDITFVKGRGFTAQHQMRVQDKMSDITMADVLAVAEIFDIRRAGAIVDDVQSAIARWEAFSEDFDVAPDKVAAIRAELDRRARLTAG
jgi:serine/threonine-protein kinase HipA